MNSPGYEDSALRAILILLSDGEYHSGQELGDILGVSRTAVWKHLQKLEAFGITLSAIKGKGYCLEGGLDLLDAKAIRQALPPELECLVPEIDIKTVIDSTNTYVMQYGAPRASGYVCLAEQQTAGKGRRGRQWVSPFGKNIYLSLLWHFEGGAAAMEGLSLAVGVAITQALSDCGIADVQLKWPNDVLWRKRKLAGVLLEMTGDPAGNCQVVVGVGINVAMPASSGSAIDQPWVDIQTILAESDAAHRPARNHFVAALLARLLVMMQTYTEKKFSTYRASWEKLNAYADQTVELYMANSTIVGTMLGVSDSGALRLQTDIGEKLIYGGEVSVRNAS